MELRLDDTRRPKPPNFYVRVKVPGQRARLLSTRTNDPQLVAAAALHVTAEAHRRAGVPRDSQPVNPESHEQENRP